MDNTTLALPQGATQIGVHGKGGGVDITSIKGDLIERNMVFAENDTHLIYGTVK